MDFRMETFITVCKTMSFTKAADCLGITQPAVSQHIHYLEQEYGAKLFEFTGKRMKCTEAGNLLLSVTLTMKHDERYLKEQLKSGSEKRAHLNFGATLTVGEFMMPKKVADYLKKHGNTSLSMQVANTSELLKRLDSGEIDFAIVEGYFKKNDYDHRIYAREPYIGVCAFDHVFESHIKSVEDLFSETLVTREPGSGTREILEKTLEGKNYSIDDFKAVVEIGNIHVIKLLVQQDCGITFLYRAAVSKELEQGSLKIIAFGGRSLYHDITFIWRKGSIFAPYYEPLFHELKG